ncbi:GNAT family N-acetyltransferase [Lysinibacillus xylanilyticus]|nr:GNAT family N-acetyltransferase [Lysinibacillus xylanilyticus]
MGKLLFKACITWAKERNVDSIELNVWEINKKAIDFYKQTFLSLSYNYEKT